MNAQKKQQLRTLWKKTRAFLADDSSILSWLVNLLIAFVVIKFIIYPVLSLLFGSTLPVVAVVSSSMDHGAVDGTICGKRADSVHGFDEYWNQCGGWYEARGITKAEFSEYPFRRGFDKGDIMVLVGPSRSEIKQGDILVFEAQQQYPIIHRLVNVTTVDGEIIRSTKGDHNADQISEYMVASALGASRCHTKGMPAPCPIGEPVTRITPGAVRVIDETYITDDQVIGKAVLRVPWLGWVKIWFTDLLSLIF